MKQTIQGLWAPLVTPMFYGAFDEQSMKKLIASLEPYVSGYVPAMSSGEGPLLSDETWEKVITCVTKSTSKPVIASVLGRNPERMLELAEKAKNLGCIGVGIPALGSDDAEKVAFITDMASRLPLPMLVYNMEGSSIHLIDSIKTIDQLEQVIAIKDSSGDKFLFKQMVQAKSNGEITTSILQGVEYNTEFSQGCDGYLTAIINVEPQLSKKLYEDYSRMVTQEIMDKFWQYNLGGEWFVTLKAILFCRGILRSAEQVRPTIAPGAPQY